MSQAPSPQSEDNPIKLIIQILPNGAEFDVELSHKTSIEEIYDEMIKGKLLPKTKEEFHFMCQRMAGKRLFYDKSLKELGIQNGDTILIYSSEETYSILNLILKVFPGGEEIEVEVHSNVTIADIRDEMISQKLLPKIKGGYHYISKNRGQNLTLDKSLHVLDIEDGDTILISPENDIFSIIRFKEKISNVPNEILNKGSVYIENYVKQLESKTFYNKPQPLNECKLIFIGSGEVGKTSIIKRLVEDKFNELEPKTAGIEITKWSLGKGKKNIKLNIWDFGGQEIMHATHKFFLTRRSVYILVINPRVQDQHSGDIEINYWLKIISSFAGLSPIIIVINKIDIHKIDLAKGAIKDRFPQVIGFVETSCKTNTGIDKVKSLIQNAISSLNHLQDIIPLNYLKVKEKLESTNKDYLHYFEYISLCKKVDSKLKEKDLEILIGLLNDLGVMLNISENRRLADTQVLNPKWITNGVYSIINSKLLIENRGVINEDQIKDILNPKLYPTIKERGFIMDMMNHFELCFQMPNREFTYFIPGAFPKDKPPSLGWDFDNYLHFQLRYDILPNSIISRLLVKMHDLIYKNNYWRQGTIIYDDGNYALVEALPFEKKITIKIAGKNDRRILLSHIRKELDIIHRSISKLKVESFISLDEKGEVIVNYHDLLSYEEEGIEIYFEPKSRKKYSVKGLLYGIENRIDYKKLKQEISKGKVDLVLEELKFDFPDNNEVLTLLARINKLKSDRNSGVLDNDNYRREEYAIVISTLSFIDNYL